jgi:hypothetical protein
MDHEKIELNTVNKMFEFEKMSREIDSYSDLDSLKNICKSYVKLYIKQQEILSDINTAFDSK